MNPTFAEKSRAPGSVKHRVYLELMEVTSTLYAGALITLLLVLVRLYFTAAVHEVHKWITWLADVKHLRTLPSPSKAKRWIFGHAFEVLHLLYGYS